MKSIKSLEFQWLILIVITLFNANLGEQFHSILVVNIIIAFTTMYKGLIVIDHFMELKQANKVLRLLMRVYFIFFPMLIVVTLFI